MTELLRNPQEAEEWCAAKRAGGLSIGFVPTMGALHDGHLELVKRSARENDATVVSIFVNPLQFDESSDFDSYPRDFEGDGAMLAAVGCSMAFTGTLAGFFPGRLDANGALPVTELEDPGPRALGLEGEYRPGHFPGVATIVKRLFEVCRPERAYFGQKDFQQTLVVEDVARSLGYPRVVVCPTVREATGLAMSSRNTRLDAAGRDQALALSRALASARDAWREGERDAARLREAMLSVLEPANLALEYAAIREPSRWTAEEPTGSLQEGVALIAARVGDVRLIDNMVLAETP